MRNHRRAWLAILSLAALAALVWLFLPARESEPVYQGKPLRHWLALYSPSSAAESSPADEAIRQIGTNAIPILLEMLQEKDSPLKLKWITLLRKQPFIQPPLLTSWRNIEAARGFQALGATASNAVPTLIRVYRMKISFRSQGETLLALRGIGPAAFPDANPVFLDGLSSTNLYLRQTATEAICQAHPQPNVFVPALINALKDSDSFVRSVAARALAAYGPAPKPAVPTLVGLLNDPESGVRVEAAFALKAIDPVAAMPGLINALKDSDAYVRISAASALTAYGPAAKSAVPALVALLDDPEPSVRAEAAATLKAIDPVAAANAGIK